MEALACEEGSRKTTNALDQLHKNIGRFGITTPVGYSWYMNKYGQADTIII